MEKLKFALFSIVTLSLLGLLGYWSVITLQSGTDYKITQKIEKLEKENEELKEKTGELERELVTLEQRFVTQSGQSPQGEVLKEEKPVATNEEPDSTVVYKNQSLITELEKLAGENIVLKLKSQGTKVGTVQKFLNLYNKTSNKVDNDYGEGTKTALIAFQKAQGLSADGEAGRTTFNKMIDWLKKQG